MENIIRKLASRKLWVAVCGFVSLLLISKGESQESAARVAEIIMAGASLLGYIIGEGLVDAAREGGEVIVAPVVKGEETEE